MTRSPKKRARRSPNAALARRKVAAILRNERKHRARYGLVRAGELDQLTYPTYFAAYIDHHETGIGRTRGLILGHADEPYDIREAANDCWTKFLSTGMLVRAGLEPAPEARDLLPDGTAWVIEHTDGRPGRLFSFATLLHFNFA